jgi:hypothetical protein
MELKYKQSDNITTEKKLNIEVLKVWIITPDHESAEEEPK